MGETSFVDLKVSSVTPVTEEAVCISFAIPDALRKRFTYAAGQYLTLQMSIDGASVTRSYSICSSVGDPDMQIAIKRVPGGVVSNFVNDTLKVGDTVALMPPQGSFSAVLDPDNAKNYLFIAAGSGITPVISNIKSIYAV